MTLSSIGTSASPPAAAPRNWDGPLESFVAGYADTLGYIALFGLFTSHVTGNFVVLGSTLVNHDDGVVLKLMTFPVFIVGVALSRQFSVVAKKRQRAVERPLIFIQAVLMLLFMFFGIYSHPEAGPDSAGAMLTGMAGVLAMSVQNTRSRQSSATANTVMTGNVTQLVIDLVDRMQERDTAASTKLNGRIATIGSHVLGFGIGAMGAAAGYMALGYWALLIPIAILLCCGRKSADAARA